MSEPPPIFLCQVCDQTPERGHAPDCPGWEMMTDETRALAERCELLEAQLEVERVACDRACRAAAEQGEALAALRDWRCKVTVAFGHEGGTFYDDVPKHIRTLTQERDEARQQRDRLRKALVGLVGVANEDELDAMETVIRALPASVDDQVAIIAAIRTLKETPHAD